MKLADWFCTEIGNTFIIKKYQLDFLFANYRDTTPVLFNMYGGLLYKNGRGALFICNYVPFSPTSPAGHMPSAFRTSCILKRMISA